MLLPKPSLPCLSAGVAFSVIGVPPRSISNVERAAGAGADDPLHVGEALDLAAVDGEHDVAGLEARPRPRPIPAAPHRPARSWSACRRA